MLDAGTYTLSLRSDAHTVKNDLTYDFTVDQTIKYDTTARSTDETVATNQFDDVTAGDGNIGTPCRIFPVQIGKEPILAVKQAKTQLPTQRLLC